jgi:peroxiredoxin
MSHKAAVESRARRQAEAALQNQRRRRGRLIWAVAGFALLVIVAAMMLTSRPGSSDTVQDAHDFRLTDTTGASHTLAQHHGQNVLIYFSEGAGCQSCLVQMAEIEKKANEFAAQNITVLPVVMNTREQIIHDMALNGVTTPFLLDDGTVSNEYGTLGKGMHAGLPGHSFVLIDASGKQRWYGEYPSMWLSPDDLLDEVRGRLSS